MQEARFYEKLEEQKVQCHLCAHECKIDPGKRGICHVRENQEGTLYTFSYGRLVAQNVDAILCACIARTTTSPSTPGCTGGG